MSDYQIEIFTGNLGKDPESRFTPAGQQVCSFSVASNRQYTNAAGESVKETTWRRVSAWGKLAEICNTYLKKGSRVLIEGRLSPDKSTGAPKMFKREDGSYSASYDVMAQTVTFLSAHTTSDDSMVGVAQGVGGQVTQLPPEDDIPF